MLDGMFNAAVNSKKRVKEAKNHLAASFSHIAENKDKLVRLYFKEKTLRTIEGLNDLVYLMEQKIEAGFFYEALQIYQKAVARFESLDSGVRETGVVQRISELLTAKKSEIHQLCVYFLIDQIFNTEVLNKNDELLDQIDFGKVVFDLSAETQEFSSRQDVDFSKPGKMTTAGEEDESPFGDKDKFTKPKTFARKRVNFIFSIVKNMQAFDAERFLTFIDTEKLDAMIGSCS